MYIYSGECRLCKCGLSTTLEDDSGEELRTGDIVMSYTASEDLGATNFNGLTVVVADHFENYQGLEPIERIEKEQPFIMGIKSSAIDETIKKYPSQVWRVRRLKKYEDVIDGEHWQDFGFSFKNAQEIK